jgi:hypothetical protein
MAKRWSPAARQQTASPARLPDSRVGRFVCAYFERIEREVGLFPGADRWLFPAYMRGPQQVWIYTNEVGDFGIHARRSAPHMLIRELPARGPIEAALHLPYDAGRSCWRIASTNAVLHGLAVVINTPGTVNPFEGDIRASVLVANGITGFIRLEGSSDVRLIDTRIAFRLGQRQKLLKLHFLWLITRARADSLFEAGLAQSLAEREVYGQIRILAFRTDKNRVSEVGRGKLLASLSELLRQYHELVVRSDTLEAELQSFLEDSWGILDPQAVRCVPGRSFGTDYRSDFVLEYADSTYRLVEIEVPHAPIITRSGLGWRARHAVKQVEDWRAWLAENPSGLTGKRERRAWAIVGRVGDLDGPSLKLLSEANADPSGVLVRGFDELEDSIRGRMLALGP